MKETNQTKKYRNPYGDGDIPDIDLPQSSRKDDQPIEPLPESTRPRKDGPGGE